MKKKQNTTQLPDEDKIEFQINDFKILNFFYIEPDALKISGFDPSKIKIGLNYQIGLSRDQNALRLILHIDYNYDHEDKQKNLLKLIFQTDFTIMNFDDAVKIDNKININEMLLATIFSIAYSSARGIIFSKTQGTFFSQFILPLVNPQDVINRKTITDIHIDE